MKKYPVVIGRFEHVDIVDKLDGVPAKIDTGAYRSAIHACDIQLIDKKGKKFLKFTIGNHPSFGRKRTIQTSSFTEIEVMSSSGHKTKRYEVTLKIRLGYKIFQTSFTLADRTHHVFPVLIGRKAIRSRFLVDVTRSGVNRNELRAAASELIKRGDEEYLEELEK